MYLKRHDPCVLFLEGVFGTNEWPEKLRAAGFDVVCYADHFQDHLGRPQDSVKDPEIIKFCHKNKYVLITMDKQLCHAHLNAMKKTDILVIATESNRIGLKVWIDALITAKPRIERLVRKSERPCSARISKTGKLTVDQDFLKGSTKKGKTHTQKERQK